MVPLALDRALALDVGATTRPLVTTSDPALGTVQESVAGSRLVLSLSGLHTFDTDGLAGTVGLAGIGVPRSAGRRRSRRSAGDARHRGPGPGSR